MATMNSLNNNVIPALIPQISDPKIIVQTFNAPNAPILPNSLPQPKVELNVHLPKPNAPVYKVHTRTIIRRESPEIAAGLQEIKQAVEKEFEKVMQKEDPTHSRFYFKGMSTYTGRKSPQYRFEVLSNPTDRTLFQIYSQKRVEDILDRVSNLKTNLKIYSEEVDSRLSYLKFLQRKWMRYQYNVIV
jgi:hypothetical protein